MLRAAGLLCVWMLLMVAALRHAADYGFGAAAEAIGYVNGELEVDAKHRDWIMGLRTDPFFSALMAGELIKDVERALQAEGERELAEAELYLAHFLGASSAVRFLEVLDQDPNRKASKLFPKAAKANAGLFMEGKGRKRRPVSVAELYDKIDSKIVRRLDRCGKRLQRCLCHGWTSDEGRKQCSLSRTFSS